MKNKITLENIKSISHDTLAELLYVQVNNDGILCSKIEKLLLKNDPKALIKSIKKEIASIRRGRKFIGYYEAFDFADKITNIVDDIGLMVEDDKVASELFKELVLTDSKVYLRSDDSSGAIQMSYAKAEEGWHGCLYALSDDEIYADIMEMLVCEGFGIREVFSDKVPDAVLQKIYDVTYEKLKTKKSLDTFDDMQVLKACAHYMKKPQLYIKACTVDGSEISEIDRVVLAEEYKYANDPKATLDTLTEIKSIDEYRAKKFYELQIWAQETLGNSLEVTLAYKNWYTVTKSVDVLKTYLSRLDGVMQKQAKEEALNDAQKLSFSSAMHFFYSLDEQALASAYIWEHQNALETEYLYSNNLKKIANWLKEAYPQEAILLYRDSCEKALATSHSKHYPSAIRALKECLKIEKENDTLSWAIEENMIYMERLINKHKRKPKFVELFFKAFGDL
jgi:ribosome-associated translation inhibitor RaiA